jgi:1-acyl-sn-glycerol-3-phosphate acyltransferase
MIKHLWYYTFRIYVKIVLFFLLKKKTVFGIENIPKEGAVLFIGNHQNALIDALIIPTITKRKIHFLARAGVFKKNIVKKFLSTLNMLPAYRLRDGVENMNKNYDVFNLCVEILNNKGALEIFAEGEHHIERRIIPLKKGFARIILSTLQKYPETKIQIVPIGLNYDTRINFPSKTTVYFGEPILANPFFNLKNPDISFSNIIKKVSSELKKLTLHIDESHNYNEVISKLENCGIDYLNPVEANKMVAELQIIQSKEPSKIAINWFLPFHLIAKLNSIIPILIWNKLKKGITDIIFMNTFRFAMIATLFPIFYLLQTVLVYYFFNIKYALVYLISSILLGVIYTKTSPIR